MAVKVRINGRTYTLSWAEFERMILVKPASASVEILQIA